MEVATRARGPTRLASQLRLTLHEVTAWPVAHHRPAGPTTWARWPPVVFCGLFQATADGTVFAAYLPREDVHGVVDLPHGSPYASLAELPAGARVDTSAIRHNSQLPSTARNSRQASGVATSSEAPVCARLNHIDNDRIGVQFGQQRPHRSGLFLASRTSGPHLAGWRRTWPSPTPRASVNEYRPAAQHTNHVRSISPAETSSISCDTGSLNEASTSVQTCTSLRSACSMFAPSICPVRRLQLERTRAYRVRARFSGP